MKEISTSPKMESKEKFIELNIHGTKFWLIANMCKHFAFQVGTELKNKEKWEHNETPKNVASNYGAKLCN